jgi:hypothetical protein
MNFRLTAILFGTIFALAVVLLVLSYTGDDKPPTDVLLEELAGAKPDDVTAVEVEREGKEKLRLERASGTAPWRLAEPYAAKADAAAVNEVVAALLRAKPVAHPELTANPSVHGLQPPGLRVTLRQGDKAATVNLGDVSTGGNRGVVYVTTSARPDRPMAVSRRDFDPLFRETDKSGKAADFAKWVGDYRSKTVFPADARGAGDDVTAVALAAKGKTLSLARSPAGGWSFVSPADWGSADPAGDPAAPPGTFTGVTRLLGALTSLQAQTAADFVENPSPQDLEKYGLADNSPDRVKVELRTKEGETTTAYIGKKEPDPAALPGVPGSGKWWVKVDGQPGVIKATGGDLSGLAAAVENPDPLRDRNLLAFDKARIDGLDLGPVKLRKVGGGGGGFHGGGGAQWKLYGNPAAGDPQPAAAAEVEKVLNLLTEKRTVKGFPKPDPAAFGANDPVVRVWADGFEAPPAPKKDEKPDPAAEPTEKGKPVTLTFGRREAGGVNVRRVGADGKTDYFLLPDRVTVAGGKDPVELVAALTRPRVDFLDRDLKKWNSVNAGRLTAQGAVAFDLERAEDADPSAGGPGWRFAADAKGPAGQEYKKGELADAPTVQGILDLLATTPSAVRIADEAPTPQKLDEYGLGEKTTGLRVAVGLRDAAPDDKERVFEFGKETAPGSGEVYARQKGRPAVLVLSKLLPDRVTSADLRNRAIFRFDPAAVGKIDVSGWGSLFGAPAELTLEKGKDGGWAATKAPTPGFVAGPERVRAFLAALGSLQVKAFTTDRGEPEPRHGLVDPRQAFVVTLWDAAGKDHVLHLRLGGPTEPAGGVLYAITNRVPGGRPIVTVDASALKPYRDAPAALAK